LELPLEKNLIEEKNFCKKNLCGKYFSRKLFY